MTYPKKPIYWYQGLFLQPQHLQQLDIYHEALNTPLRKYITPYFWGVCNLEINTTLLKDYTIDITAGEFIFKDGTWLSIGHNAVIEERSFKSVWEKNHSSFIVYVALKRLNVNSVENVDANQQHKQLPRSRFVLDENQNEINDLYNHEQTAQIECLDYVLKLIWANEIEYYPDYEIIPVAKIDYNGQDAVLSQSFSPPVVNIKHSSILLTYLKNTTDMLRSRAVLLSNYKSLRKALDGEFQPASLPFLLGLKTISHFVPLLNHYKETPCISPWEVYGILRQLLGELSMVSDNIDVLGHSSSGELLIPPYDHTDLAYCFKKVCILIDEIIEGLIGSMESVIYFVHDGNFFNASIPIELLRDTNKFYLCIKSSLNSDYVINTITDAIKIGCSEDVAILIKRALSGIPISPLKEPPLGISRRKDVTYFNLDHKHPSWQSVKEYANMSIYLSEMSDNVEISLLVLKGGELLK